MLKLLTIEKKALHACENKSREGMCMKTIDKAEK